MTKHYCDICGLEILRNQSILSNLFSPTTLSWICKSCNRKLEEALKEKIKEIREEMKENEETPEIPDATTPGDDVSSGTGGQGQPEDSGDIGGEQPPDSEGDTYKDQSGLGGS